MMQESPRGSGDSWFARALHGREGMMPYVATIIVVLGILGVILLALLDMFPMRLSSGAPERPDEVPRDTGVLQAVDALSDDAPPVDVQVRILQQVAELGKDDPSEPELTREQKLQLLNSVHGL